MDSVLLFAEKISALSQKGNPKQLNSKLQEYLQKSSDSGNVTLELSVNELLQLTMAMHVFTNMDIKEDKDTAELFRRGIEVCKLLKKGLVSESDAIMLSSSDALITIQLLSDYLRECVPLIGTQKN